MRFALLATSTLVALALASYACSSSDDTNATGTDAGAKNTSSSSSGSKGDDDDVASSSGESSSGETSSSSGSSSGQSSSSGEAGASSSGSGSSSGTPIDGGTAGTKCVTNDQLEGATDHSTEGTAQALTPTTGTATTGFCGKLGAGESDFWTYTFTVDGAFGYSEAASFSAAKPTITIITGGEEFPWDAVPTGKIKSGQAVVFKVTSDHAVDYHISFNVTKS